MTDRQRRRGKREARSAAADRAHAVVGVLEDRIHRERSPVPPAVAGWFANSRGRPTVAVDERIVARFVRAHFRATLGLLRAADDGIRQMAIWAASTSRDPRIAAPLVEVVTGEHHMFDHDFVFDAARRLGARGVAAFERIARTRTGRSRTNAIDCIGASGSGRTGTAAIRRLVAKVDYHDGVLRALENLHHAGAIGIATPALASTDAQQIEDALMAIQSALEQLPRPARIPHRKRTRHLVLAVLDRPECRTSPGDPWQSTFASALEVLLRLDRARCRAVVASLSRANITDDRIEYLREIQQQLRARNR